MSYQPPGSWDFGMILQSLLMVPYAANNLVLEYAQQHVEAPYFYEPVL